MKKQIMSILLIAVMVISLIPSIFLDATAVPASQPIISVEEVWAAAGSTVEVNVTVSGNPGIYGATLTISWAEGLELIDAESGDVFNGLSYQEPSRYVSSGTNFIWYGTRLREIQDGTALKLTFEVAENVEESSVLAINVSGNGLTDANNSALSASFVSGGVRIVNYIPGDTDGNDTIDPRDLVALAKYISDNCTTDPDGFNVTINENAADVNDDGELNPMDLVLIAKYISDGCKTDPEGYNIILKPSSPKCTHNMQEKDAKTPSCTEDGNIAYWYCSKCEKYFGDKTGTQEITLAATVISAKGHTEVVDAAKAPTCTETGLTEGKHCSVCGEVIVAQTEIAANGHTEAIDAAKAPTCTKIGLTAGKHCSVCGEVIIAQTEIAANGHTEAIDAAKAATCTETGLTEGKHCSVCSIVLVPQTEVPASHSYVDGICSACGYILPSEGLEFALDGTGESYSVTGMGTCTDTKVVIPSVHNGKPVTSIDNWAFSECIDLTSVTIPDSVISIGSAAFLGCTSLSEVNIGTGLNSIGLEAFTDCAGLSGIWVDVDNHIYSNDSRGVLFSKDMTTLIQAPGGISGAYTIPDSVKSIGYNAFICCRLLDSVTIPDSVTSVGDYAFQYCDSLSIRCEAVSEPEGWSSGWNPDNRPVIWDINHTQHVYTAVVTAPTCTEVGYTTYTCACGDTYTADEVAALGHTEAIDAAKAPTCTETGLTEGKHCSVCGEVIVLQTEIAANGHNLGIYLTETVNLTHTNSTTYPFTNTNGKWYSTNKGNSTSSTYTVTVPCDCTATVEYGVSSESNYDKFTIKKNTTTLATISGNTTESKTLELVAGDKITFTYSKDSSVNVGSDSGWFKITATGASLFSQSVTMQNCTDDVYCNVCNKLIYAKLGHDSVIDAGYVATCTTSGLTEGSHCARCNEIIVAQTEIPASGHTEVVDAAKNATCTETGLTEGKHCSVCNEVFVAQTEIAAIGHVLCLYDDVHIALTHKNATNYPFKNTDGKWYATNAAYTTSTYTLTAPADCTVTVECGLSTSSSYDYLDVKHNSTRLVRLTGNKTETRTLELGAGDTLAFEYYKSGYSSTSAWFKIIDAVAKNAETTSVTAHCTQDVICKYCERVFYPKTGHSSVTDPGRAATCTETGLTDGQICSVCDEVVSTKRVISPTGHSYTNNACTVCNHALTPSTGLAYSLKEDGTYMITGLGTCTDKTIIIPANINGKDVTYIAGEAFLRKGSFTGLYIPGTVKSIGSSAFEDTYFNFIYMEEGVTSVGSNAFAGSYGGNSLIVIPSTLTSIGSQAFMCGADCVVINSQEAASRLTAYDGAGYLLYHSQSALIRSDLSYGSYANQLGYPAVPVEFMGEQYNSFSHNQHSYERCEIMDWTGMRCTSCHMLSDFAEVTLDVSAGDTDSVTAHIYSEAGKGIMKLSGYGNISYSIPSTYMYIVEEIIIEEGILSIPQRSFYYYSNLERVTVPSSVASIGSEAFGNCDSLVSIEVSAENQHYMSLGGDLYSKDGTSLIQYAIGKKSEAFNIPQGVVSIGESAFYSCGNLTKVVIPNGVTTIGSFAFSSCTNLSNVELPGSLMSIGGLAFNGCSKLNKIILPDGMTAIGVEAFRSCTGLESIVLPNSLTSIGSYAFYDCSALVDITIPDSVTSIDSFAFAECTSLTSIVIPNSVASMGRYVFSKTALLVCCEAASKPSGWDADWNRSDSGGNLWIVWNYGGEHGVDENGIKWALLNTGGVAVYGYDGDKTELTIPTSINGKTVTTIIDKAFYNCKTLKNVIVGNTITSIGASAFESCTKLESITIPDDVTYIGDSAFKNCTKLKIVNLGTNITDVNGYTFYGCTSLTSIVIPDSVTTIGYYAFKGCTSLTSVTIGKKVTSIDYSAFEGCVALTALALPDGLESIGSSAFEGCTALMTVVIPDSVTSIGSDAFFNCTNLSIFCEATQQPTGWSSNWKRKSQAGSSYYVHSVTWGYKGD